jgi:hypothetical protein
MAELNAGKGIEYDPAKSKATGKVRRSRTRKESMKDERK